MPCSMSESRVLGTKLVSVYPQNPSRGLPTIGALYVLQAGNGFHAAVFLAFAGFFFREKFGLPLADVSVLVSFAVLL